MVIRYKNTPLIVPEDVCPFDSRFEVIGAFNPGVTEYEGKTLLLMRVAVRPKQTEGILSVPVMRDGKIDVLQLDKTRYDCSDSRVAVADGERYLTSMSYFVAATSEDGVHFTPDETRCLLPSEELEEYGIEDPRITYTEGYYYVVYSAISRHGICGMMRRTRDFRTYERIGIVMHPDNKDIALFPEKIGNKYYMLHRPSTSEFGRPELWIAESDNLRDWGNHRHMAGVRPNAWDSSRIGSSGIPIRVEEGWLLVYHGANYDNVYCLGAMLLDADEPWRVKARTDLPFMSPELPCEKEGFFSNVIFACGGIESEGKLRIYYGAADQYICGGEVEICKIMEVLQ